MYQAAPKLHLRFAASSQNYLPYAAIDREELVIGGNGAEYQRLISAPITNAVYMRAWLDGGCWSLIVHPPCFPAYRPAGRHDPAARITIRKDGKVEPLSTGQHELPFPKDVC